MQESLDSTPQVLIDPNTWSKDGTVALAGTVDQRRRPLPGLRRGRGRQRLAHLADHGDRQPPAVLADELKWIKFTNVAWTADNHGFFYSRFDEPPEGAAFQSLNLNQKLWYHRVGTPQSADVLVYRRPDQPEWGFLPEVSEDGRWLIVSVWKGTDPRYRILYRDLSEPYGDAGRADRQLRQRVQLPRQRRPGVLLQDRRRGPAPPRGRHRHAHDPQREHWREIIPQAEETLTGVNLVGNQFVAAYLKDAITQIKLYTLDGKPVREVEFPGIGTASGFSGQRTDTETFYSFSSFATPPSIYRYDLITGESTLLRRSGAKVEPDEYEVKQVFYRSKDGTRVPMFLAHKKGLKLDGNNPTLLYGYGGFNIPLTPGFSISRAMWMEMGGVFAVANLRGGGEYGEAWHAAGTKLNKQNVFDDFIAAAEWLIDNKYTQSKKLAIQGGSNGGLLVGAVMTQRPELFGACLPAVGVMDMLRFHKFTAGRYWVDDYGSCRQRRGVPGAVRLFALPQPEARNEVSADAGDDGRHGRPRGAGAQLQVRRGSAACPAGRRRRC